MFAPLKPWRRWHRHVNLNQRRVALASALAASALVPLVMARGHRIEAVPEIPLVLSNDIQTIQKTKQAISWLKVIGADADAERVKNNKKIRVGVGKMRNRRYIHRVGPLVVYKENAGIVKAFRNIPGIELCCVDKLNLLRMAPGGHLGRFCIWVEDAFKRLAELYGDPITPSSLKHGFHLPRALLTNGDLTSILGSDVVLSQLQAKRRPKSRVGQKKNPLKNLEMMRKLNPHIITLRRQQLKREATTEQRHAARAEKLKTIRNKPNQIAHRKKLRLQKKAMTAAMLTTTTA